ncbi:uncharacterized protein [Malus domestica]|uniref:uncharacterized protein n=1 Tax=Malus domestica TaxID=3750 RepID=UPI003976F6B9
MAWQKELLVGNKQYNNFSNQLQSCDLEGVLSAYGERGKKKVQQVRLKMENRGIEELVIQLEQSMDLLIMESGVKLVGKVLTSKVVNIWGVGNIIKAAWNEYGGVEIKWVKENIFTISVKDESMASKLLEQASWAAMKKIFSIKKWPSDLALEEIVLENVPFWVQIRGVPMCFVSLQNIKRLTKEVGEFIAIEDPGKAGGFLRVRLSIDTNRPLFNGCWLRRDQNRETWVEFRFEKLQDFCYRYGRIGHVNTECTFEVTHGRTAGYGE